MMGQVPLPPPNSKHIDHEIMVETLRQIAWYQKRITFTRRMTMIIWLSAAVLAAILLTVHQIGVTHIAR